MNENETASKYFLRVEETMNAMNGLGEGTDEEPLVQKILRSFPKRFNPKFFSIE